MSNHITIELCAEDRKRIDELICFAGMIAGEMQSQAPATIKATELKDITLQATEPAASAEPDPVTEPEPPRYTKADVLAMVQKLAAPNSSKREQAKAIVKSYGAKVSDIPEDKYNEVMTKLTDLEVGA